MAKAVWIQLLEGPNLAAAKAIYVSSEIEAQGTRAMRLDLAPVAVIADGVNRPERAPTLVEIEEVWSDREPGRRVGFVARLDWTKGADMAIDAARAHSNAVIRLA